VPNSGRAELGVRAVTVLGPDGQPAGAGIVGIVPGGPAATAGLTPGEVITSIDNTAVHSTADLVSALATRTPGTQVTVTVTDTNGPPHVTATLGELPGSQGHV
jgi:putative serine protease PepD